MCPQDAVVPTICLFQEEQTDRISGNRQKQILFTACSICGDITTELASYVFIMPILNISRAVTEVILGQAPNKTLGAQQHNIVNIYGRFHNSISKL